MGYLGTIIRLKMPSDILRYNGICHPACMRLLWVITSCYSVLGKHAPPKGNCFFDSCFRGRKTWIRLRHAKANGKRRVSCMITSCSLGSPPAPLSTRPLSSLRSLGLTDYVWNVKLACRKDTVHLLESALRY